jgi:hypothetical protein
LKEGVDPNFPSFFMKEVDLEDLKNDLLEKADSLN